jgi:hypothetical protein
MALKASYNIFKSRYFSAISLRPIQQFFIGYLLQRCSYLCKTLHPFYYRIGVRSNTPLGVGRITILPAALYLLVYI